MAHKLVVPLALAGFQIKRHQAFAEQRIAVPLGAIEVGRRQFDAGIDQAQFFIRRPIVAIVLSILIFLVGWAALLGLPVEQYPQLASQQRFADLMTQLEGTENRINVAIQDYNKSVQSYNTTIRTFPDIIGARIVHGAKPMSPFEAVSPNANVAPTVNFGN
jgi:hypothetical protein